MTPGKKIYFASDFHLGIPSHGKSLEREKRIVRWLDNIKGTAEEVYLVGDLFDFWFEYKTVVPKYYVRLLGKLAELTDSGIPVTVLVGNHDMWMFGYLQKELNIPVIKHPITREWAGKKFFIGHGDGLGPGDKGYKFIKKVFRNPVSQWLFARVHPNLGIGMANFWSKRSRLAQGATAESFRGEDKEWLLQFSKKKLESGFFDYFVFGHRHLPLDIPLEGNSRYINLGDWITNFSYAEFDGKNMELRQFEG